MNESSLKNFLQKDQVKFSQYQYQFVEKTLNSSSFKYKVPMPLLKQRAKNSKDNLPPDIVEKLTKLLDQKPLLEVRFQDKTKQNRRIKQYQNELTINLVNFSKQAMQITEQLLQSKRATLKCLNYYLHQNKEYIKNLSSNLSTTIKILLKGILKVFQKAIKIVSVKDLEEKFMIDGIIEFLVLFMKKSANQAEQKNHILKTEIQLPVLCNKVLLSLVFVKYYKVFGEAQQLYIQAQEIIQLINYLSIIEQRTLGKEDEFYLMRELIISCSYALLFRSSGNVQPKNFSRYIKFQENHLRERNRNNILVDKLLINETKEQNQQFTEFYQLLNRYIILDIDYAEALKKFIINCLQSQLHTDVVRKHFLVICQKIAQRFPHLQTKMLTQLISQEYSGRDLAFIALLISDLINFQGNQDILIREKQYFISFANYGKQIKKVLLKSYFDLAMKSSVLSQSRIKYCLRIDKVIFNSILEWNMQCQLIDHTQVFVNDFVKKYIQFINQSNLQAIHQGSSNILKRKVLQCYLDYRIYSYIQKHKDPPQFSKIFNENHFKIKIKQTVLMSQIQFHPNSPPTQHNSILITCLIYYELIIKIIFYQKLTMTQSKKQSSIYDGNQRQEHRFFYNSIKNLANSSQKNESLKVRYNFNIRAKLIELHQSLLEIVKKRNMNDEYLISMMIVFESVCEGYDISQNWTFYLEKLVTFNSPKFKKFILDCLQLFQNKLTSFLLLACEIRSSIQNDSSVRIGIEIHNMKEQQQSPELLIYQQLLKKNQYAYLNMYCLHNLHAMLFLRKINGSQRVRSKILEMLKIWKKMINSTHSTQLLYSFSTQQPILKEIYTIFQSINKQKEDKSPGNIFNNYKFLVFENIELINNLISIKKQIGKWEDFDVASQFFSEENNNYNTYLFGTQNQVCLLPIQETANLFPMTFSCNILMNFGLQTNNFLAFSGKDVRYKFILRGNEISIDRKILNSSIRDQFLSQSALVSSTDPEVHESYKEILRYKISKNYINKCFNLKVIHVNESQKLMVYVGGQICAQLPMSQLVQTIKFEMKGFLYVSNIQVSQCFNDGQNIATSILVYDQNYSVLSNAIECKLKRLLTVSLIDFQKVFNYEHLILLIKQIMQNSQTKTCNFLFEKGKFNYLFDYTFNMYIKFILNYQYRLRNGERYSSALKCQYKSMMKVFKGMFDQIMRKDNKQLSSQTLQVYFEKINLINDISEENLYVLLKLSVLRAQFWVYSSLQTRVSLISFLKKKLLSSLQKLENEENIVFYRILRIFKIEASQQLNSASLQNLISISKIVKPKIQLIELIQEILFKHKLNKTLLWKFHHFYYEAETEDLISKEFRGFLEKLVDIGLKGKPTQENPNPNYHIVEYLFQDFKTIQLILCSQKLYNSKLFQLVRTQFNSFVSEHMAKLLYSMPVQILTQLIPHLNVILDQICQQKSDCIKKYQLIGSCIENMLPHWSILEQKISKQFILMLIKIFAGLPKVDNSNLKNQQAIILPKQTIKYPHCTLLTNALIKFIIDLIIDKKYEDPTYQPFIIVVFEAYLNGPKNALLHFLTMYRKFSENSLEQLLFPLTFKHMEYSICHLPIYSLSAFLQYIFQCCIILARGYYQEQQRNTFCKTITQYMEFVVFKYKSFMSQKIDKIYVNDPIFYLYPKIYHDAAFEIVNKPTLEDTTQILRANFMKKIQEIQLASFYELRGGIYFKIVTIVIQLIQLYPTYNYVPILQKLFFDEGQENTIQNECNSPIKRNSLGFQKQKQHCSPTKKKTDAIYRIGSDFKNINNENTCRFPSIILMNNFDKDHQKYFKNYDSAIKQIPRYQCGKDLTPYIIDYALLKISKILENKLDDFFFIQIYSIFVGHSLQKCKQVYHEIKQGKTNSNLKLFEDYKQFLKVQIFIKQEIRKLNNPQQIRNINAMEEKSELERIFSPNNFSIYGNESTPKKASSNFLDDIESHFNESRFDMFITKSPSDRPRKSSEDFPNLESPIKLKRRNTLAIHEKMINDPSSWNTEFSQQKIHSLFCIQAKQLLLLEYIHSYYVQRSISVSKGQKIISKNKQFYQFRQVHQKILDTIEIEANRIFEKYKVQGNHVQSINSYRNKVRLIFPFTVSLKPMYKIKSLNMKNSARPYLLKTIKNVFNNTRHNLRLSYRMLSSIDIVESPFKTNRLRGLLADVQLCQVAQLNEISDEKQPQQDKFCQLITRKGSFFCQWQLKGKYLNLTSKQQKPSFEDFYDGRYGSPHGQILKKQKKNFEINLEQANQIFVRKYNQTLNIAVEIFKDNGKSYFIVFYTQNRVNYFLRYIKRNKLLESKCNLIMSSFKEFNKKGYAQSWANGQISNFDYLMLINKYSGRSYSDLNQYFIFPWIIDYSCKQYDLNNFKMFRDLTKPIGALNQKRINHIMEKYQCSLKATQNQNDAFMYGSHYSTSLFIYYYLVRIQPFTTLRKFIVYLDRQMQSGSFDAADRIFNSINEMWQCIMHDTNTSDIKQAIPQFYYFPTFLKNINRLDMGYRQSKIRVGDVQLPKWANNSPEQFIAKMRAALQSDYVSMFLPHWIDLIFGIHQRSKEKMNIFHPCSYYNNINLKEISNKEIEPRISQITYFGQNPLILFTKEHIKKKTAIQWKFLGQQGFKKKNPFKTEFDMKDFKKKLMEVRCANAELPVDKYLFQSQLNGPKIINLYVVSIRNKANQQFRKEIIQIDLQREDLMSIIGKIQRLKQSKQMKKSKISRQGIEPRSKVVEDVVLFNDKKSWIQDKIILQGQNLNYNFTSTKSNELFVVLYGELGLRILSWQMNLIWQYITIHESISDVFVDDLVVIFVTSTGRCYLYDVVAKKKRRLYIMSTKYKCYSTRMFVKKTKRIIPKIKENQTKETSIPSKLFTMRLNKNREQVTSILDDFQNRTGNMYRILLIGDLRKFVVLELFHVVGSTID